MKTTSLQLATQIADDLFTNGTGKKAKRLVLELQEFPKHYGGGLCREAVISRVQQHLEQNLFWSLA